MGLGLPRRETPLDANWHQHQLDVMKIRSFSAACKLQGLEDKGTGDVITMDTLPGCVRPGILDFHNEDVEEHKVDEFKGV